MKSFIAACLLFTAASAHAENFFCKESSQDAIQQNRAQYAVSIIEKSAITDKRVIGNSDYAKHVLVTVLSRDPKSSLKFTAVRPAFAAIAKNEDVMYSVNATKSNGVSIMIYLDELDQTSVKLKGITKSLQMTCTGTEHG